MSSSQLSVKGAFAREKAIAAQQVAVARKEQELVELQGELTERESQLNSLVRTVGARSQRVDVATCVETRA